MLRFGSGKRIRTSTYGVRVRCATITQYRYVNFASDIIQCGMHIVKSFLHKNRSLNHSHRGVRRAAASRQVVVPPRCKAYAPPSRTARKAVILQAGNSAHFQISTARRGSGNTELRPHGSVPYPPNGFSCQHCKYAESCNIQPRKSVVCLCVIIQYEIGKARFCGFNQKHLINRKQQQSNRCRCGEGH